MKMTNVAVAKSAFVFWPSPHMLEYYSTQEKVSLGKKRNRNVPWHQMRGAASNLEPTASIAVHLIQPAKIYIPV